MCDEGQKAEVLPPKETIDLLMRKYAVMYSALLMRASSFTSHVRNSQLVVTLMIAVITASHYTEFKLNGDTKEGWVLATVIIMAATYYIWYDTLDAHFAVVSHSARIKTLENQINKIAGRDLLVWERVIAPKLWGSARPFKGVLHPVRPMLAFQALLMVALAAGFPVSVYIVAWRLSDGAVRFKALLVCLTLLSVALIGLAYYVWWGLNYRLNDRIVEFVDKHWQPDMVRGDAAGAQIGTEIEATRISSGP
jgi:hypothetical protein